MPETIYVIVSEDGQQELIDFDNDKILAFERREDAQQMIDNLGDDHGPLHIESREITDG